VVHNTSRRYRAIDNDEPSDLFGTHFAGQNVRAEKADIKSGKVWLKCGLTTPLVSLKWSMGRKSGEHHPHPTKVGDRSPVSFSGTAGSAFDSVRSAFDPVLARFCRIGLRPCACSVLTGRRSTVCLPDTSMTSLISSPRLVIKLRLCCFSQVEILSTLQSLSCIREVQDTQNDKMLGPGTYTFCIALFAAIGTFLFVSYVLQRRKLEANR